MKTFIKLFFLLSVFQLNSQIAGESTYQFLNLSSSPRQLALGGKEITLFDFDVNQPSINPASINSRMDNNLSINFSNYLSDINYGTAAYAYTYNNRGSTLHFGLSYIDYGNFSGYDEQGNPTNDFTGKESAFSIGYSTKIKYSPIYLGSNLRFITSSLEQYNSIGVSADIGIIYIDSDQNLNIGMVVRNIGTQLKAYNDVYEKLPLEIDIGVSQLLENAPLRWHLTFENVQKWNIGLSNPSRLTTDLDGNITQEKVTFFNNIFRHLIIGAELFPESIFNIRLGYNFKRGEELKIIDQSNFSGVSFGFGMKFNKLRINYTHAKFSSAANTSFIGLQLNLN
ncbi:type IX secretion system protein PorQ [Flavobacteriaceae bacterium]|nr:type IX secretion system protein PorQ [Flavobacteriaceae bacterium]MDB9712640.1 type IX secretion system protein PorQ [Flavobacteriaceae bacterium]MDC1491810.1 type IX secretion system protein PorQ [Flavobacteriaceae bacterium]